MSQVKWTDEAIERGLEYCRKFEVAGQGDNTSEQLKRALLELKRVRAWVRAGYNLDNPAVGYHGKHREILRNILNGDTAPSEEAT